jgi:hypothetical protein
MATTITAGNATNGLAFSADNTGILEFKTSTGAGTTALTLDASQNATFAGTVASSTGTLYPLVLGTAVSASGTSVNFTSIPATVERVTVILNGISTSGTSPPMIRLGTSGGLATSGYNAVVGGISTTDNVTRSALASIGFLTFTSVSGWTAASLLYGSIVFTNISGNIWIGNGSFFASGANYTTTAVGQISLAGVLDRIQLLAFNTTDTFDAGTINILWE